MKASLGSVIGQLIACKLPGNRLIESPPTAPADGHFPLDKAGPLHILPLASDRALMRIEIDKIKEEGLSRTFCNDAQTFPELVRLAAEGECTFTAPITVSIRAQRIGELIEVSGQLSTTLGLACGRCLKPFTQPLQSDFELTFSRQEPASAQTDEEEVELSADDLGLVGFSGDVIDLAEPLQEQVLLALPLQPLCDETCRGLCPQCGVDLNSGTCACATSDEFDNRFAALKNFKPQR